VNIVLRCIIVLMLFVVESSVMCGCAKNEKLLKQNQNDLVDLKYNVSMLDKKQKEFEASLKGLHSQSVSSGKSSFSEQDKLENLLNIKEEQAKKLSSNSMKINALELEVSQIKNYLVAKNEKTELISKRLNSLSKKVTRSPVKKKTSKKTARVLKTPVKHKNSAKNLYEDSMTLMELNRFEEAIKNFRKFGEEFPNSSLADNAQYWVGECYYALKEYEQAIKEFQIVLDGSFSDKNKAPDAMLKKGFSYKELKQYDKAVSVLNSLISAYGTSPSHQYIVGRARAKMEAIPSGD